MKIKYVFVFAALLATAASSSVLSQQALAANRVALKGATASSAQRARSLAYTKT
jgi:hypothetical protein